MFQLTIEELLLSESLFQRSLNKFLIGQGSQTRTLRDEGNIEGGVFFKKAKISSFDRMSLVGLLGLHRKMALVFSPMCRIIS